jgi:hypothetical protein
LEVLAENGKIMVFRKKRKDKLEIDNDDHHSSWYAKGEGKSPKGGKCNGNGKANKRGRGKGEDHDHSTFVCIPSLMLCNLQKMKKCINGGEGRGKAMRLERGGSSATQMYVILMALANKEE